MMDPRRQVVLTGEALVIVVPWRIRRRSGRRVIEPQLPDTSVLATRPALLSASPLALAVARAHRWQQLLDSGRFETISDLARALRKAQGRSTHVDDSSYVTRILKLTLLAPDIVSAILDGDAPCGLSLEQMKVIPELWEEQRLKFGFAE